MIDQDLLIKNGKIIKCDKAEVLFKKGDTPKYFFQVRKGAVKMNNFNDDGKEFIQGIFMEGDSFGEPPLLINESYPSNAVTITAAEIYLMPKEKFLNLILSNPEIHLHITNVLAKRLFYKSIMASEISSEEPEHRVLKLIDHFKVKVNKIPAETKHRVEITRQQIADLTGLRVETVIRAIKSLERKGELTIESRKVYR